MRLCILLSGVLKWLEDEDLDDNVKKRLKDSSETPGALWHVYTSKDVDKVKEFLHKVTRGFVATSIHFIFLLLLKSLIYEEHLITFPLKINHSVLVALESDPVTLL